MACGCRAMHFIAELLQGLHDDSSLTLAGAASKAYAATLERYHSWFTSTAFVLALKVRFLVQSGCVLLHACK